MNKKRYLTILTIITVICILAGLYLHIFSHIFHLFGGPSAGNGNTITDSVDYDGFNSISIDTDVFNVDIRKGDRYNVSYECSEFERPVITNNNGELKITEKNSRHFFVNIGRGMKDNRLTVTIPESSNLSYASLNTDAGNFIVDGITVKKMNVKADAGNVNISDSSAGELEIETDAGNVAADNITSEQVTVNTDVGNVSISGKIGILNGDSDVGNISLDYDEGSDCRVTLTTDVGNITVNGAEKGNKYIK